MAFSVAPLLKRRNPSPAYGHGWIMGVDGKRWHPSHCQRTLLRGLSTHKPTWFKSFCNRFGG